ncbi:MAG: xanthine dehydrogenase family protein molybdopterin-binding subunit [Anaerolineales bacterium]|nr:xanthine dehydrogenase family protein molybdopterin-binding subunit [Anaerolineales bacterium]
MRDGIGDSPKRLEDQRFLKGLGSYVSDLNRPRMVHAVIVRSPHAHARIRNIDISAAAQVQGFVRCVTAGDIGPMKPIPVRIGADPALTPHLQRPLASDTVQYVGEPVAVVLAETYNAAEDAAELVDVEYEPLSAIADAHAGLAAGKVVARWEVGFGDVEAAFGKADCVVRERFTVARQTAVPLEPRGLVAEFDVGRRVLTMWGPTKVPYFNRGVLSAMLGLPESQIHFIEPDVGGGFGARGEFYPEDFLVPFATIMVGRPVKWIETRREHFLSINHSRGQTWEIAIAASKDGLLLGIEASVLHDQGAYVRTHGTVVPTLSTAHLTGAYRIANYRCAVTCVLTNRTPTGTMRGPGLFECNLVRERAVDMIASQLGMDAAELRRRNLVPHEMMPYEVGTNIYGNRTLLDSGNFVRMFDKTLDFARSGFKSSDASPGCLTGFGLAAIVEPSGWGPYESARVEVDPSGTVRVYTGATSQGQGQETTLAQICREILKVPLDNITVVHGDTQLMRFGVGTYASRAAVTAGNAVLKASKIVYEQALELASQYLEAAPADLVFDSGQIHIAGVRDRYVTLGEIARIAGPGVRHPNIQKGESAKEGLSALAYYDVADETCSFSVHTAQVTVDIATGRVTVDRYVVAADAGRAINPMIVEAQLVGGAVQGLSGALCEQLAYDSNGQLLAATFMDYSLPRARDFPRVDALVLEDEPAPNPLGVKGIGEGGTSGAGAAIANAVANALRPLGVRVCDLPLTSERLWKVIQSTDSQSDNADT